FECLRRSLIEKINDETLMDTYHRYCIANDDRRQPFAFPFQANQDEISLSEEDMYTRPSHQRVILEKDTATGVVRLTVWGRMLTFSEAAEPAVRHIFASPRFGPKELAAAAPRLTREDVGALVRSLIGEGVIVLDAGS